MKYYYKILYLLILLPVQAYADWESAYDQVREARGRYYSQLKEGPLTSESRKAASAGLTESNTALANELVKIDQQSLDKLTGAPTPMRTNASVKEFVDSPLTPEVDATPAIDGSKVPKFIEFKSKNKR